MKCKGWRDQFFIHTFLSKVSSICDKKLDYMSVIFATDIKFKFCHLWSSFFLKWKISLYENITFVNRSTAIFQRNDIFVTRPLTLTLKAGVETFIFNWYNILLPEIQFHLEKLFLNVLYIALYTGRSNVPICWFMFG